MDTLKNQETKEQRKRRKALLRGEKENQQALASIDPNVKITVLCVRFGNKYGREYVERLRNMVSRHMTIPYEFVCLTDDQHPIAGVRSIVQPNANYARGWWHKVHMFDPNIPLSGRILYFDLDVVIHANINKLAGYLITEFVGILDFNRKFHANWKYLNSSVLAWNHRSQTHIWDQFKNNPKEAQRMPGDQDWIWKLSQSTIKFWPREWIQSYKWEIRSREELTLTNGKRQFTNIRDDVVIEPGCSVAVFHGDPNPCAVRDKFVLDNWR
jgi:hypothetical protein